MRVFSILLFSLLWTGLAPAATPEQIYEEANQAYRNQNWQAAADAYQRILAQGVEAADLYYNLGNVYYKMDKSGQAILNYERALKLDPLNEDIRSNLETARRGVPDQIDRDATLPIWKLLDRLLNMGSDHFWGGLALLALWILALVTVLSIYSGRSLWRRLLVPLLSVLVITGTIYGYWIYRDSTNRYAIVMEPKVVIRSAPDVKGTELFDLHEGVRLQIREHTQKWYRIRLADGQSGWIPKISVEEI